MADQVEQVMQDMVPEFDDLARKRIFEEAELKQIIRRRRDFEYSLHKTPSKPQDYLSYVQYEVALECLRRRRSKALHWKKKTLSDFAGIGRIHSIFNRGLAKFKADVRFWYQHVDFCLRSGSTKALSKVLAKAMRYHPREIHFWLLGADRELKLGHVKAARTLLLRALRFSPTSPKLWGELVRLEAQVARNLSVVRSAGPPSQNADEGAFASTEAKDQQPQAAPAQTDVWSPVRLIFQRALGRLDGLPQKCAMFLETVCSCVDKAISEPVTSASDSTGGLQQWQRDCRAAVDGRRPGVATAPAAWAAAPDDVALQVWELWWTQERAEGRSWRGIARVVLADAPLAVAKRCAAVLGEAAKMEGSLPLKALTEFTSSPRVAGDDPTALAVLEAMEPCTPLGETQKHASSLLAARTSSAPPASARLRLLALGAAVAAAQPGGAAALLAGAKELEAVDAALLFTTAVADGAAEVGAVLEASLRALASNAAPTPLVEAVLAHSLCRGLSEFHSAADNLVAIGAKLWDAPTLRTELLASVLDAELKVLNPSQSTVKRMQARFEDLLPLLDDADPAKIDWWVRYLGLAHRAAHHGCAAALPSVTTLHWRAMRSVADQALYTERSQQLQMFT